MISSSLHPKVISLLLFCFLVIRQTDAQFLLPQFSAKYSQADVSDIRITMHPDSLEQMLSELSNEHEYPATFVFINSAINDTIENIGFRLRGNTSLNSEKKSFKVSFNTFDPGNQWRDLEKLNLIGQQNDPSLVRSKLCHDAYRNNGIAAARTAYVNLYINEELKGVYLNVEHIDENFAKAYFDDNGDGNLYKCTYPADMDYLGSDPDLYAQLTPWGSQPYEMTINEEISDYSDLAELIDVLNNTPLSQLECELPEVFNVEKYLMAAALEVLLGHWDGYIFNKNNFYLYHNKRSGVFEFIPYDMDNTLGIDWVGINWTDRNIYNWSQSGEDRPMFKRLLQVPAFRNKYTENIYYLINEYFGQPQFAQSAINLQTLIHDDVLNDPFYPLDFGFTPDVFENSLNSGWELQVNFGVLEYMDLRIAAAQEQLETFSESGAKVYWLQPQFDAGNQIYQHIQALLTQTDEEQCRLMLSNDNQNWTEASTFSDNGILPDQFTDSIYTFRAVAPVAQNKLYYKIECDGSVNSIPCESGFIWNTPSGHALFINEVMPSNSSTLADNNGEYDDWLEIYNAGTTAINLQNFYVTDEKHNWNKFRLPSVTLDPGGFKIVWLDGQPEQGALHANFSLSSGENEVWLNTVMEGVPRLVNYFAYPGSPVGEISWERITDGSAIINFTDEPTPNTTNFTIISVEEQGNSFVVYPNPASNEINFSEMINSLRVYDSLGKIIGNYNMIRKLDVANFAAGVYTFVADDYVCRVSIQP